MVITRRNFVKGASSGLLYAALGESVLTMDSCNVFTDLESWIPVGLQAFDYIIQLVDGALPFPMLATVTIIRTAFNDVLADVKAYQAIVPPPAGMAARIKAMFELILMNFQNLLADLQLNGGPIVALVIVLAKILLSTIAGFIGRLPAGSLKTLTFRVAQNDVSYTPQVRTTVKFKHDWNVAVVSNNHTELELN